MEDLNDQILNGTFTFTQWNGNQSELQNLVELSQTLSGADLQQLIKAVQLLGGHGNYFTASGTDTVTLTGIAASGPGLESYVDGYQIRFRPANANTGAVTVAVDGLAAVDLVNEDGTALAANALATTQDAIARYDASAGDFFLQVASAATTITEELLSTTVVSAAADAVVAIPSAGGFEEYRIECRRMIPATDNIDFQMQIADDGVPTFFSGGTDYSFAHRQDSQGGTQSSGAAGASIKLARQIGNTAGEAWDTDVLIKNPGDGTNPFVCNVIGSGFIATGVYAAVHAGGGGITSGISVLRMTHLRFFMSAGNITSGTIRVWGIRR